MSSAEELAAELAATSDRLKALTAEVALNEEKMRRSQHRELRLLEAEDIETLFEELTEGLRDSYGLETVSLVLCDPDYDLRHLMLVAGTPVESMPQVLVFESLTGLAPQYVALRKPWLGAYAACDHQLVFPVADRIASVAMIPLLQRGHLFGSINLGSDDADRFTRHHASDFLQHLGLIASYCIENVLNRARLLRSGFTDVLTGWNNRRYLQVRLKEELGRARREQDSLVCLMLDVDHFKGINDRFGHAAGDTVLRDLAGRVDAEIRASDVAARYGGEEFVVLLPATEAEAAEVLAERIRNAVGSEPFELPGGGSIAVTVSIGIAAITPDAQSNDLKTLGDSLLARADVALYRAKSAGRDCVIVEAA